MTSQLKMKRGHCLVGIASSAARVRAFVLPFSWFVLTLSANCKTSSSMNFVEELRWRGMLHQLMPGTEELIQKERVTAYVGIDPTADSLHIGHLCGVMMLRLFQHCGHKPLALIGGATGMIGDPSGKSQERNLLNEETLAHNINGIKKQLERFLDFNSDAPNAAELVNNYDWMKNYSFLEFVRDIGKHITVNYMMAKDSVQKRLNGEARDGLSFTEFSYQLLQGYDFLYLYKTKNCKLQMGGSDQWGNITTGSELIRRTLGPDNEVYALTCPLITKADGRKFGKTESGNIWLDAERTTPYEFYQFWLNVSDEEAARYIKIFTLLGREEVEALIAEHSLDPGRRQLQRRLGEEVTVMVHGREEYEKALAATEILFGKATKESLLKLDEKTLLAVFSGVPHFEVARAEAVGAKAVDLFAEKTQCFASKGEMRKLVQGGGVSLNKEKLSAFDKTITEEDLLDGKYLLVQRGKKNYYLITVK
jgi:tyrosine--tRNA ligase